MVTYETHTALKTIAGLSGPGLDGAEHLEQVQELQKAGRGSDVSIWGVEKYGDQMPMNQ